MSGRNVLWIGLALILPGIAAAQVAPEGTEEERRGRLVEGAGAEISRVDSIPLSIDGTAHELRALVLVTDTQTCAALTAGHVSRRDQDPGKIAELPYVAGLVQPRFGPETLDPEDRVGTGHVVNDVLVVDLRNAASGAAAAAPSSQSLAAGIGAATRPCRSIVAVNRPYRPRAGETDTASVAVAISLGDLPTVTVIDPTASYTLDREAFRRLDLAVGGGGAGAIPAYAMTIAWWGK